MSETDKDRIQDYIPGLSAETYSLLHAHFGAVQQFNDSLKLVPQSHLLDLANNSFADCALGLQLCQSKEMFKGTVYDFGSGNGFPGLILSILRPDLEVVLVERDIKKADFLKHMVSTLNLRNARVLPQSISLIPKESVDVGLVRGLGSLANVTIQMTSAFKPDGLLYHFKGDNWPSELATCPTQVFAKWDIQLLGEYQLPSGISRFIVTSRKIG